MSRRSNQTRQHRRGAIFLLTVFLMVFLLGVIAFAVDIGYVLVAKTQLQTAADSAALAGAARMGFGLDQADIEAIKFANLNNVCKTSVQMTDTDTAYGTWDSTTRQFTESAQGVGNAIKVTVSADGTKNESIPLFFGRVFDRQSVNAQVSAIATTNPRDICFVVDLSSSMNDDSDPASQPSIDASYPGVGTRMMQDLFDDLGYGTYPGTTNIKAGAPLFSYKSGSPAVSYTATFANFYDISASSKSPLLHKKQPITIGGVSYSVPAQYRVYVSGDGSGQTPDTTATATKKAYSWVMDAQIHGLGQITGIMPNAKPTPNSTDSNNYNYWYRYINGNQTNLGYKSYVAAIEPSGCDKPFTSGSPTSTLYGPTSKNSPDCPFHSESTDGGTFSFPPREMPTHSARRAIISAIKVVKDRNEYITNTNQKDWVSLVTYDVQSHSTIAFSLSGDYNAAMQACTQLQACGATSSCTATETGLMTAQIHLDNVGRSYTNKVVVLLTDGKPNLTSSTQTTIANYRTAHPNSNFYGGTSYYPQDAALMQTSMMYGNHQMFFPIALGLQDDPTFMNKMYSMGKGKTTTTDVSPYTASGDPTTYEAQLRDLFFKVISAPRVRLVQ